MGTRLLEVKQSRARAGPRAHPAPRAPSRGILPSLIGYQLRLAQKAIFEDFADSVNGTGISPGLFGVLVIIEANPGLTQQALADAMHLDRSTMVNTLDKLGDRDLVERRATDRRSNGLFLTETGISTLRGLKRKIARHEQRVVENLSVRERVKLISLLQRILPKRR